MKTSLPPKDALDVDTDNCHEASSLPGFAANDLPATSARDRKSRRTVIDHDDDDDDASMDPLSETGDKTVGGAIIHPSLPPSTLVKESSSRRPSQNAWTGDDERTSTTSGLSIS